MRTIRIERRPQYQSKTYEQLKYEKGICFQNGTYVQPNLRISIKYAYDIRWLLPIKLIEKM